MATDQTCARLALLVMIVPFLAAIENRSILDTSKSRLGDADFCANSGSIPFGISHTEATLGSSLRPEHGGGAKMPVDVVILIDSKGISLDVHAGQSIVSL